MATTGQMHESVLPQVLSLGASRESVANGIFPQSSSDLCESTLGFSLPPLCCEAGRLWRSETPTRTRPVTERVADIQRLAFSLIAHNHATLAVT